MESEINFGLNNVTIVVNYKIKQVVFLCIQIIKNCPLVRLKTSNSLKLKSYLSSENIESQSIEIFLKKTCS